VETRVRRWDTAGLVLLVTFGVTALLVVEFSGSVTASSSFQLAFAVLGLAFAIGVAVRPGQPPRTRRAWRLMLPTYALWPLTISLYAMFQGQPFPSVPDVLRLLITPVTLLGILAFTRLPASATERAKLRLDAGLVGIGAAMVLWYLVVSPALATTGAGWRELVPSIVHPILDTALLFGISVVLIRGSSTAPANRVPLLIIVVAALMCLIGDTVRAYVLNHGGPVMPSVLQQLLWTSNIFLLMLAPYVQTWLSRRPSLAVRTGGHGRSSRPPRWPYLTVVPGYLLLMATVGVEQPYPAAGLIAGAFLVSVLAYGRQMVSARENRRMAVTDMLTGLANRLELHEALPRALTRAAHNGTRVGVLVIDMNGFKQVNDTLGHRAGDRLLIGFAGMLRECVLGSDLVARLGGDEFAIMLPDLTDETQAQAVVRRIRDAMSAPIDVGASAVQPNASIGVALSHPGELSADDLLHRADLAMYEGKGIEARVR
jgi:diguanylate cyclase (GGDEF)-like protein